MNSSPINFINVAFDPSLWLIVAGVVICLVAAVSVRRSPATVRFGAKLLAMFALQLAMFVGLFWSRGSSTLTIHQMATQGITERASSPPLEMRSLENAPSTMTREIESKSSNLERPEWTRQAVLFDGHRKLVSVGSGRFASEQEAELHGLEQATIAAVKEYSSRDPLGFGKVQPQHMDLVKGTAIKQRFLEVAQHDFGKFQAPMYQLWLQVELTSQLGDQLVEPWKQTAIDARLRTLATWGLWSTAAAALAAFALRLDAAWSGRRRATIVGTAVAITLGSLAFLA